MPHAAFVESIGSPHPLARLSSSHPSPQVTRAFGDLYLKSHEFNREPLHTKFRVPEPFHPPLVTADPHIAVRMLAPHDTFLVVASDGLFELMTNQEVVDLVASSPRKVRKLRGRGRGLY